MKSPLTILHLEDNPEDAALIRSALEDGGIACEVTRVETETAPAHHYILAVDFQGDDLWVATGAGLSHGIRLK